MSKSLKATQESSVGAKTRTQDLSPLQPSRFPCSISLEFSNWGKLETLGGKSHFNQEFFIFRVWRGTQRLEQDLPAPQLAIMDGCSAFRWTVSGELHKGGCSDAPSHRPTSQVSCNRIGWSIKIQSEILLPMGKKSVKKPHLIKPPDLRSAHKKPPRIRPR